jgi:macrophage erythroblast attacher
VVSVFRKQRANRFIIEHLLRNGYFETAQKLADYVGADNNNKNVFHVAKQVEESLKRRDLSICLHWVLDNRSKLHRLHSSFESEVRIQQLIELLKDKKGIEAVNFMRTYFGNPSQPQKWSETLLKVMGLFAVGPNTQVDPYRHLLTDERWDKMVKIAVSFKFFLL